jgi:hypothetical protein
MTSGEGNIPFESLRDQYVREIRAVIWNEARIQALEFLYETQRAELQKMTVRTARYKIEFAKLFVRLMRLTS